MAVGYTDALGRFSVPATAEEAARVNNQHVGLLLWLLNHMVNKSFFVPEEEWKAIKTDQVLTVQPIIGEGVKVLITPTSPEQRLGVVYVTPPSWPTKIEKT